MGYADVEPEIAARVEAAVRVFQQLGAIVEEVDPGIENPFPIFRTFWINDALVLQAAKAYEMIHLFKTPEEF